MSDSFILMVILLTASVALLNIFSIPAPLRVWVPTALGSYKEIEKFALPGDKSRLASSHHSGIILPRGSLDSRFSAHCYCKGLARHRLSGGIACMVFQIMGLE